MTPLQALVTAVIIATLCLPAAALAHHVGTYTPRDNEVSANFKQIKFSIQARKFDVARRLFETGALRQELRARAETLPPGLEQATRSALSAGDGRAADVALAVFIAGLARDLAVEAQRQVGDVRLAAGVRAEAGRKFLEAIWRYYNLIDFVVSQRDTKAAVGIRLAFDEAETYVKSSDADPARMRAPLERIAQILTGVIEMSSPIARRQS